MPLTPMTPLPPSIPKLTRTPRIKPTDESLAKRRQLVSRYTMEYCARVLEDNPAAVDNLYAHVTAAKNGIEVGRKVSRRKAGGVAGGVPAGEATTAIRE